MQIKTVDLYEYFNVTRPVGALGTLTCYLKQVSQEYCAKRYRPAMLILPGGAYAFRSDREGEPIALEFLTKGFNAFVLNYSTKREGDTNYPYQLLEGAMAIAYIRENSEQLFVRTDRVGAVGFSAGGHLCAMLATLTGEKIVSDFLGERAKLSRPDAVILSYSVISSGEYANVGSFDNLTGDNKQLRAYLSLENRVDKNSVPAFIWSTYDDTSVPCENSLLMALAYRKAGVPMELHVFETGYHGISLATKEVNTPFPANECWIDLAITWLVNRDFIFIDKGE